MGGPEPADESVPFDTNVPHIARVYNYWLGGKDNFAADRAAAEQSRALSSCTGGGPEPRRWARNAS